LTAHPSGRWCKKIKGRTFYFGSLSDPDAALEKWLNEKDYLLAGRVPPDCKPDAPTLRDLGNEFLRHKQSLMNSGELSPRTFADCYRTCANLIDFFGRHRLLDDFRQEDFAGYREKLAKRLGPIALGNEIQKTRSVFKFAVETGMQKSPVVFGPGFKRPSKRTLRLERAKKGPKLFTAEELRKLISCAGIPLKAMILLACNAGLGNSDLANMPAETVNLKTGWVDYPRVKTGVRRSFSLWPETLDAIRATIGKRPAPRDEADSGLLFITKYGRRWCKTVFEPILDAEATDLLSAKRNDNEREHVVKRAHRANNDNEVTKEFNKLFALAGIERKGRSFYAIRHVFETVGGESRDQIAVDHIMGHAREDMASVYRERISDERIEAVVDHVRTWLFSDANLLGEKNDGTTS
jgi:integrase